MILNSGRKSVLALCLSVGVLSMAACDGQPTIAYKEIAPEDSLCSSPLPSTFEPIGASLNPFQDSIYIVVSMPLKTQMSLVVYGPGSDVVRVLLNQVVCAGTVTIIWDGVNDDGKQVEDGLYQVTMTTAYYTSTIAIQRKR